MVERERLHGGNWNVKPSAGFIFNRSWFEIVEAAPVNLITARYWDKAGTDGGGCYTAGVKMGKDMQTGLVYVLDVVRGQWSAGAREQLIRQMAILDGTDTKVYTEQEPGSGGKESAQNSVINLQGFSAYADPVRGNKLKRAYPFSSYAEARNVKLLRGHWNQDYLSELHSFSPDDDGFKDQVDASSGCFNKLALHARSFVMQCAGAVSESGRSSVEAMVQRTGYYWPGDR
jgi:predicted phage terminase large subunit-like protein